MAESRAKRLWTTVANWPKAKRARTSSAFHVETPLGHIGQLAQRGEFVGKNLRFWRFGPGCGPTGSAVVSPLLRGEKAFTERNLLPRLDLCNVFSRRLRHPYRSGNPKIQEPNSKGQIRIAGAETKERKSGISRTKFQGPSPNCQSRNKGAEIRNFKNQIRSSKSELPKPKQRPDSRVHHELEYFASLPSSRHGWQSTRRPNTLNHNDL